MNKRQLCLAHVVKNHIVWPAKSDSPGAKSHHGYSWRKIEPRSEWILVNQFGDTVTHFDSTRHYEETVKMSEVFDTSLFSGASYPEGDINLSFTADQYRAMCSAIRQHDGLKAKIKQVRLNARRLYGELGEDHG